MQTSLLERPAVSLRRVQALVNPASGGVGPEAAGELAAVLAELGLDHRVVQLVPGQAEAMMRAAVAAAPDAVIVLGGDGTARLAAALSGPSGPPVVPLSGGTMSKLGHALYGPGPWREILRSILVGGEARWVSGGEVEGRAFFCRAVLGPPALLAPAREAIREHKLRRAWRRTLYASRRAGMTRLGYQFDGQSGRGLAIGLICPTVSRALDQDEAALEAAVLDPPGARAGVRLALTNLFGEWREDPDVTVRPFVTGRIWAREPIPVMLDGEFFRFGRQVHARFRPRAFRALVPRAMAFEKRPELVRAAVL